MGFFLGNIPTNLTITGRRVLLYVDEGWGRDRVELIERVVLVALMNAKWSSGHELYLIAYLWRDAEATMVDLWRFTENPIDGISGPLADIRVMRDGQLTQEFGAASGNTLLVLGLEEKHRRGCEDLGQYLENRPILPKDMIVGVH